MRMPVPLACALIAGLAGAAPLHALDVGDADAVREAYLDHIDADADADPGDICVAADPQFPETAIVAGFAHDRGCMVETILVDDDWLAPTMASEPALELAGWDDADAARRAELAMAWTRFAVFAFRTAVSTANDDFARPDAPAFTAPTTEPDGADGVVVTLWVQEEAGMLPETEYNLWELTFDRDGAMVRIRVLATYVAEY
ncbi:MAG: hypothetical protein R3F55_13610 [Alphaproteobacteria bacterium]